jgi:hypothetical protein
MEHADWSESTEMTTGGDDPAWSGRVVSWIRPVGQYAGAAPQRLATVLVAVGFLFVLAAAWFPWANVHTVGETTTRNDIQVSIADGLVPLTITYYLMWMVLLSLAGATIFAPQRTRLVFFGATTGALVAQLVALMPLLHHPKTMFSSLIDALQSRGDGADLLVTRQSGMYCALLAVLVIAAAMVVVVRGRVLPTTTEPVEVPVAVAPPAEDEAEEPYPPIAIQGTRRGARHDAGRDNDTVEVSPDRTPANSFMVTAYEALPEQETMPVTPIDPDDHAPYVRPRGPHRH